MFDRTGRDADGRVVTGSRARSMARHGLRIEPLEGRAMMTASIAPIANVVAQQYEGYQVPLVGGTTHAQTYTVTSDNPGVKATIAQGQFLTIGVNHASSGASDPAFSGTMTFQLFQDLTPTAVSKISSLVNGTATGLASGVTIGSDYYVNKIFHRVANGFPDANGYIVQGGSLNGDGTGQVFATPYPNQFNTQLAFTNSGQLALANSGNDTNDSQFFVTTSTPSSLNYKYTLFGQLVDGQAILTDMSKVAVGGTSGTTPTSAITITSATLSNTSPDGVVHIDTSVAPANSTANVTVTATDVTDQSTASQTFQVGVVAPNNPTPNPPFLGPYDPVLNVGMNQVATFQLSGVATVPGDQLTYTVQGGTTSSTTGGTTTTTFTPIATTSGTATVSSTGLVSVTPAAGFTGAISVLVGVRDQTNRAGTATVDSPANYDTHVITLNVGTTTTTVAQRPLSQQATVSAPTGSATPIQLFSSNPNNTETQPLTYTLSAQPSHGTITGFNATTGALSYTPTPGYLGPDAFTYTVNDPNNTNTATNVSFPTTVQLNVVNATTSALRFFADNLTTSTTTPGVLVITPPASTTNAPNTIGVTDLGGNIITTVNGVVDALQPAATNVDSITVYGARSNDTITIDPSVTVPVLLSGGTQGTNTLKGGGGPTTELGWYGQNTLIQGSGQNFQYGKTGRVKVVQGTGTSNVIFIGKPGGFHTKNRVYKLPTPPTGTFYKFQGGKLVKTSSAFPNKTLVSPSLVSTSSVKAAAKK